MLSIDTVTLRLPFIIILGSTFFASLFAVGFIRSKFQQQLIDIPNERSSHTNPTPRGGGLGFIIAFAIALLINQILTPSPIPGIQPINWLILIPLIIVGIVDDWRSVSARIRYLVQLSVATIIVYQYGAFPQPWLSQLGTFGDGIAILLTVIGLTALINFYNFMDGLDGLVAGVTAAQLSFLALWLNEPVLWIWVAGLIGFLYWNWSPAKIFMGDAGSTTLGAVVGIALLSYNSSSGELNSHLNLTAIAIIFPLISDAIYTIFCRLSRQENIFKAHRSHVYQRLHQAGWNHSIVASIYIISTVIIASNLYLWSEFGAWLSLGYCITGIGLLEYYLYRHSIRQAYSTQREDS
jgi:Fuc2NAc and GlcNAc transferase